MSKPTYDHEIRCKEYAQLIAEVAYLRRWSLPPDWNATRMLKIQTGLFQWIEVLEGKVGSVTHLLARVCVQHLIKARDLWRKNEYERAEWALERASYTSACIKSAFAMSFAIHDAKRNKGRSEKMAERKKEKIDKALNRLTRTAPRGLTSKVAEVTELSESTVRAYLQEIGRVKKRIKK